jgi:opacity protein-like surface antigen
MKRALLGLIGSIVFALVAQAAAQTDKPADISGSWQLQIELGGGTSGTPSVTFKQDGEKLTGRYISQVVGEHDITGTIKGNEFTFGFTASFDGNAVKVTYSGTVDKDSLQGKVTFGDLGEGTFTGKKK